MKKLMALLLTLLVLIFPAFAEEDWYLETAKELTETLGVLVQDESYVAMYGRTDYACMEPLKTADFAAVKAVYRCTLPDEAGVRVLVNLSAGGSMSDAALERITAGLPNMILTAYHGKLGVEVVAASATMTFSKTYVAPEGFVPCIYLLELDGAMAAVSFSRTGDETLTATVSPLFSTEGATVEETLERFNSDNFPMEIEQIQ